VRLPFAIIAVLLAVLVPLGFLTEDDEGQPASGAPVATIARRVEAIRDLRFRTRPTPVRVSPATARREGLEDADASRSAARRRADEALYTLLGLLPPGTDLREVSGSIFGEQVAGYYDPRDGRLRIVEGAATSNRVVDEMTIAHELDHALEDQAIGLDEDATSAGDDPALAYQALVEGSATEVMYAYVSRYFASDVALGGLLGGAFASGATGDLPPFVMDSLTFPYLAGRAFVDRLVSRAGGRWDLVDRAARTRRPASTEQVLHPGKWISAEPPDAVALPGLGRRLGAGWRRLGAGTFGEFQTRELLAPAGAAAARRAAAGWGGDRYELWRRGGGACATPCVRRDALVVRWHWDTARDAAEAAAALRAAVPEALGARPAGRDRWTARGGAVALGAGARETALVVAPDARTAARAAS
jgi:hypothetical protein